MEKIISTENIIEESLLPCPFCGETSKEFSSDGKHRYQLVLLKKYVEEPDCFGIPEPQRTRFFAKCTKCGACGGLSVTGHNALTNTTITEEQAKEFAIKKWNQRKDV